jgi:hypothetical protein
MTSQPNPPADSRRLFLSTCDGEKTTAQIAAEAEIQRDATEFAEELIEIIKSTTAAQCILDEMARRQGKNMPPREFSWHQVTAEFKARFAEAYNRKPRKQSAEDFASEFADYWPLGLHAFTTGNPLAGLTKEDMTRAHREMEREALANASPIPVVWPASD